MSASSTPHLNLARKWRSRTFDELVGQEVAVSMLRNSLYKNHFFPVYLFAGQKGCGKTSSARILAAAANCEQLSAFQKDPAATAVPCLTCASCERMYTGSHADFIEIDAASHTGVDDVRTLLDSCNFMPLMGRKKIYLIDEAHMLSKAAFNAFLKVLEEPPAQVIFMLATTELHKIPDTVRSRCFQLHFTPIDRALLTEHLTTVCTQEDIAADAAALALIVHETDGSARDALNLLEQVRFAGEQITTSHVRKTLGIMSPNRLGEILALMLEHKVKEMLTALDEVSFTTLNAQRLWHLLIQLVRTLIWQTYNVTPRDASITLAPTITKRIFAAASRPRLHAILQLMWDQEPLFLATPYKHAFLEKLFLDITEQINLKELDELASLLKSKAPQAPAPTPAKAPTWPAATPAPAPQKKAAPAHPAPSAGSHGTEWQSFCTAIAGLNDPILASIFSQATCESVDPSLGRVRVSIASLNPFFKDKISDAKPQWQPLLAQHFAGCTTLSLAGGASAPPKAPAPKPAVSIPLPDRPAPMPTSPPGGGYGKRSFERPQKKAPVMVRPKGTPLVLNDDTRAQWPQADLLITHFPGKLEVLGDNTTTHTNEKQAA